LVIPAAAQKPADSHGDFTLHLTGQNAYLLPELWQRPEAIVLIHGWSCRLDYWRDQIPEFAKRTRVIAIDLPGHGQSDKPELTYSMDLFARAVDAVLRDAA